MEHSWRNPFFSASTQSTKVGVLWLGGGRSKFQMVSKGLSSMGSSSSVSGSTTLRDSPTGSTGSPKTQSAKLTLPPTLLPALRRLPNASVRTSSGREEAHLESHWSRGKTPQNLAINSYSRMLFPRGSLVNCNIQR